MELREQKSGEWAIIGITGRLDTTTYPLLEKKLMGLIEQNQDKILVECAEMDYVSSSGLRILLMALKKITQMKGRFVLTGLQDNIREIFEISGFMTIFEIHSSREEAFKLL